MRHLMAAATVLLCCAGSTAAAEEEVAPERPDHPVFEREPFGPGQDARVFSVEALTGDDPNDVPLRGLRVGVGSSEDDEFGTWGLFWGAYQHGENQTVTSGGLDVGLFSLPLGPVRLTPQFRLGAEYRSDPPDDGLAGLAGIGFEVSFWLGRSLQLAVSWDRDFGFPSGTRNLSEIAIRWAHQPGPARLSDAASRGDRDEVRRLIASGVRMDKRASHDALWYAAGWCDRPMIEMILAAWKGPADLYSELALRHLVRGCKPELAAILLDWGQDPNADYYLGATSLMSAAEVGKVETARLLLQAGARVDGRGRYDGHVVEQVCRATALMIAANRDDREMVDLLVDAGADIGLTDASGCTAEEAARSMGHADLAEHIRHRRPASGNGTEKPAPPPGNR